MGEHLKVHDEVVRPILKAAHECFVFGVKKNSPVLKVVNSLAAIKYCESRAAEDQLAFCFDFHSARGMQVYGPPQAAARPVCLSSRPPSRHHAVAAQLMPRYSGH